MHLVEILLPVADNEGRSFAAHQYADARKELTRRFGGITAFTRARWPNSAPSPSLLGSDQLANLAEHDITRDLSRVGRPARQGFDQILGLLECGFRRQRRLVGVDHGFDHRRPRGRERFAQHRRALCRIAQLVTCNAAGARDGCEVDGIKVAAELRISEERHLLPFDLAEAVVLDHDDLHVQRILGAGRELSHQHRQPAVADEGDDLTVRKCQRRGHRRCGRIGPIAHVVEDDDQIEPWMIGQGQEPSGNRHIVVRSAWDRC